MRITGGIARGYSIEVPHALDLRPSQEVVRESIFNILGDINNTLILDLYAGTGVLGIEALSRGAKHCDLVEKEKQVASAIRRNIQNVKIQDKADVFEEDARTFINRETFQKYDIIFLDPPYVERPRDVLLMIPKWLHDHGFLIYLHGKGIVLETAHDRELLGKKLVETDTRRFGATYISFIKPRIDDITPEIS